MRPIDRLCEALEARGHRVRPPTANGQRVAACPVCEAGDPKGEHLAISEGDDGRALAHCHHGCALADVLAAVGFTEKDLFHEKDAPARRILATYPYTDEAGAELFQVVRFEPKDFVQRRPDGHGGWIWNLKGVRLVPYHLTDVVKAIAEGRSVIITEGEKDADRGAAVGLVTTCNPMGAGKWRAEYDEHFRGADVVIIADRDADVKDGKPHRKGQRHAADVARHLAGVARSVAVLELPDRGDRKVKDLADWLDAGGTVSELDALVREKAVDGAVYARLEDERHEQAVGDVTDDEAPKARKAKPDRRAQLVELAEGVYELWHDADGTPYATAKAGPAATVRVRSMRNELARLYYRAHGTTCGRQALDEAIDLLQARAECDGPTLTPAVRIGGDDLRIWLDLGDPTWRAVEVDADGWRIVDRPGVRFTRPKGLARLPEPTRGGNIDLLWRIVNVRETDRVLVVAWLVGAMRPNGPYAVLLVIGAQGSAKSTTVKALRASVDPSTVATASAPKDDRDLAIAALNSWAVSFDNLGTLPAALSDALCRLATGAGFRTRALFTDSDELLISAARPILLNGIDRVAERGDLLSRAIVLDAPRIDDDDRRPESELWAEFNAALPGILGALLDAVSCAIRRLPEVRAARRPLPRMADFAEWVQAAEPALPWAPGTFLRAYAGAQAGAYETSLEGDPVADAARELAADTDADGWTGSATALLKRLRPMMDDAPEKARPASPRALSQRLKLLVAALRAVNVEVLFHDTRPKAITIRRARAAEVRESCDACDGETEPAPVADARPVANGSTCDGTGSTCDGVTDSTCDPSQTADVRRTPSQAEIGLVSALEADPVAAVAPDESPTDTCYVDEVPDDLVDEALRAEGAA